MHGKFPWARLKYCFVVHIRDIPDSNVITSLIFNTENSVVYQ